MAYQLKTEQFSGPLDKLLELIEAKKMEITAVNLGQVTGDFLEYLNSLTENDRHSSVIADFVVVASRLLLIKSKAILPNFALSEEEEKDIKDLELRLKMYREYKLAAENIKLLWNEKRVLYTRQFFAGFPSVFFPSESLTVKNLEEAAMALVGELKTLLPEKQSVHKITLTIKEKIEELMGRFKEQAEHSFKNLTKKGSKIEAIVMFLAVLHLLRDRLIEAKQDDQFSDIIIKKWKVLN